MTCGSPNGPGMFGASSSSPDASTNEGFAENLPCKNSVVSENVPLRIQKNMSYPPLRRSPKISTLSPAAAEKDQNSAPTGSSGWLIGCEIEPLTVVPGCNSPL